MPVHGVAFPAHTRHPMEAALAACARPAMMGGDTVPTDRHWRRLLDQVAATGARTSVISSEFFADAPDDETIARIVDQLGGDRVRVLVTLRPLARIMPSQWQQYVQNGLRGLAGAHAPQAAVRRAQSELPAPAPAPPAGRVLGAGRRSRAGHRGRGGRRDRGGPLRAFEALLGLPENLLRPVPDAANRSLTLAETEMLRNLDVEFRGNGLPDELYSRPVRGGAVPHMKNACPPIPGDVKIVTPRRAVEAACATGAESAERIAALGVRVLGDPALLSAVPEQPESASDEPLLASEVAARALYGALAVAAGQACVRSVHQTSSKELVRVLGHRCLKRLGRR
ncbi:hypothetical protein ACWGLF_39140 [Streptomyces puniciscabiei]